VNLRAKILSPLEPVLICGVPPFKNGRGSRGKKENEPKEMLRVVEPSVETELEGGGGESPG